MNIYQLEDYDVQGVDAGSKARIDVCQILHEQGIEALLHHYEKSRLKRLLESIKLTFIDCPISHQQMESENLKTQQRTRNYLFDP